MPATPKKTPSKAKVKAEDEGEGTPTATPKRKRTPAKKKAIEQDKEDTEGDEDENAKLKRAKATPKSKPKPKNAFRASDRKKEAEEAQAVVKGEPVDDDGDVFLDAPEQVGAAADEEDEVCKFTDPP